MNPIASLALALSLATLVPAQLASFHSMTQWTHTYPGSTWLSNVPNAAADFGVVEQLIAGNRVEATSPQLALPAGYFVASCRLRKFLTTSGARTLQLSTVLGASPAASVLVIADQPLDAFVRMPDLFFHVAQPGAQVQLRLESIDVAKTAGYYELDSCTIGFVPEGGAMVYESLTRSWTGAWGEPYASSRVREPGSAFGVVERINAVSWLEYGSRKVTLPPGVYAANARVKKVADAFPAQDLTLIAVIGGVPQQTVLPASAQTPDQFVLTPALSFTLTAPTEVWFSLRNIDTNTGKTGYLLDAFALRRVPSVKTSGAGCYTSLGQLGVYANLMRLGVAVDRRIVNVPNLGVQLFSGAAVALDLAPIGAPGCWLRVSTGFSLPFTASQGVARLIVPIPPEPALVGATFHDQAAALDPAANALGIATSNLITTCIGD